MLRTWTIKSIYYKNLHKSKVQKFICMKKKIVQKDMEFFSKVMHLAHCISFATSGQNVLVGNIIDVHLVFLWFFKNSTKNVFDSSIQT